MALRIISQGWMGECRTSCALPLRKQAGWMFLIQGLPGHFSMPVILLLDVSAVIRQAHNAKRVDAVRTSTQGHHGSSRGKVQGQGYFNVVLLVRDARDSTRVFKDLLDHPISASSLGPAVYFSFFPACGSFFFFTAATRRQGIK